MFVVGATAIDLDHYPGAVRRYGLRNPLDGFRFAFTGRVPGWAPHDSRYPVVVQRPLHRPEIALGLVVLGLSWRPLRPLALGLLWHLALDLFDILADRRTR